MRTSQGGGEEGEEVDEEEEEKVQHRSSCVVSDPKDQRSNRGFGGEREAFSPLLSDLTVPTYPTSLSISGPLLHHALDLNPCLPLFRHWCCRVLHISCNPRPLSFLTYAPFFEPEICSLVGLLVT